MFSKINYAIHLCIHYQGKVIDAQGGWVQIDTQIHKDAIKERQIHIKSIVPPFLTYQSIIITKSGVGNRWTD